MARRTEIEALLERISNRRKDDPVSPIFSEQVKQTENDDVVAALKEECIVELSEIAHALKRIDNGTYEECEVCHKPIPEARLQAIPYASKCIDCASLADT